jgi:hypothetical protein
MALQQFASIGNQYIRSSKFDRHGRELKETTNPFVRDTCDYCGYFLQSFGCFANAKEMVSLPLYKKSRN